MPFSFRLPACVLMSALSWPSAGNAGKIRLEGITLPPGFHIALFTDDVPGARSIAAGPDGLLFVGTRHEGKVYAVSYGKGSATATRVTVVASGLDSPNGVAYRDGALYVAEIGRVLRYDRIAERLDDPPAPAVVTGRFPKDRAHGWKFIRFGPDGKLYVPVGAPCNICEPGDPVYASLTRLNPDGSGFEVFARGIRNTVGFDWDPATGHLWFTDNGRDNLGDDLPPDELNRAPTPGLHFGYPYRHGKDIPDPAYAKRAGNRDFVPPALALSPHAAALGLRFYQGTQFPAEYRGRVFIAEHGSWNRSTPIGYRVMTATVAGDAASDYRVFAEGWRRGDDVWGRPVDVHVMPDGALLISDDMAGAIYRVSYSKN